MLPADILRRSLRRSLVVLRSGTFSGPFGVVLAETHHDLIKRSYGSESSNLAGHSKNPIVQQLWAARQEAKKRMKSDGIIAGQGKTPKESQVSICYPFRTYPNLLETYQVSVIKGSNRYKTRILFIDKNNGICLIGCLSSLLLFNISCRIRGDRCDLERYG